MNIKRLLIISLFLIVGSPNNYGQEMMSQKITFGQTQVTIEEILKEIIHSRKINLSYAPDAVNLNEIIQLPARQVTIGDLLKIIKSKPNVRVITKGNLVVIKKAEAVQEVPHQVVVPIKPQLRPDSTEKKDTILPRIIPQKTVLKSSKAGTDKLDAIQVKTLLQQRLSATSAPAKEPAVSAPVTVEKKKKKTKTDWMMDAGANYGTSLIMNPGDSGQIIRSKPAIYLEIKANIQRKLNKQWNIESGLGFNHSQHKLHTSFDFPVYADSLGRDSIRSQDIKLQINRLEIPVLVNYNFTISKSNFFIGAGGSIQYAVGGKRFSSNQYKSETSSISWNSTSGENIINRSFKNLNRLNYCLVCQIGLQKANWSIVSQVKSNLTPISKKQSGTSLTVSLGVTYRILP